MIEDSALKKIWLDHDGNLESNPLDAPSDSQAAWILLTDRNCTINPDIKKILLHNAAARPDVALFYGDEVVGGTDDQKPISILKTDFDLTQLLATDYIGWPLLVKSDVFDAISSSFNKDVGAFSYNLLLRISAAGYAIKRIPEVLVARSAAALRASACDRRAVLEQWVKENHPDCEIRDGRISGTFRLSRHFYDHPPVTLVIPTRQAVCFLGGPETRGRPHILNMLESLAQTSWPADRLTVLVGDDVEDNAIYEGRSWPFTLKRVSTVRAPSTPFSYARKMNELWRQTDSEHVIFMNDDLVIREADWIDALLTFTTQEDVGGAGARLLYPDGRIQHAGMAGGPMGACTHVFIGMQAEERTYCDWADIHREWSMVTGAVFATRRSLLEQIGGFDERFSIEFNDVDMCMRMRMLGFRIVYTPHAELTHFESASREVGHRPGSEVALFLQRWRELLADDPAYHPRLTRHSTNPASTAVAVPPWFK